MSRTVKKGEHWRIDAFELWCWRRLLRVPWTARTSNQSILKEIDVEAETPVLWPPDAKCWLIGKDSDPGKNWGQEEKGTTEDGMVGWRLRLNGHGFELIPVLVMDREAWRAAIHGVAKSWTWKCCTQYVSKFGKLSSGHRTGKGQLPFQSQRKAMPKNAQNTTQLHSSHTLVM